MIYTQGAVLHMDDTMKHRELSHNGTVTVEKQQQRQQFCLTPDKKKACEIKIY